MPTVQYSTKLTRDQIRALKKLSKETHIPQAVLVRKGVDIIIEELSDRAFSLDFLNLVKKKVKEDHKNAG